MQLDSFSSRVHTNDHVFIFIDAYVRIGEREGEEGCQIVKVIRRGTNSRVRDSSGMDYGNLQMTKSSRESHSLLLAPKRGMSRTLDGVAGRPPGIKRISWIIPQ